MKNILRIDSSLFNEQSVSSELLDALVEKLTRKHGIKNVVQRDLAADSVPHIDGKWLEALNTSAENRNVKQQEMVAYSDQLIQEIEDADILVLAVPMYNFSVPSVVKAWFDHIARAGRTFHYTSEGPEGMLVGKKTYLVTTRGGFHKDKISDTLMPFALNFLHFLGLDNVETIYAEGLNLGDDSREAGIAGAIKNIQSILTA